MEGADEELADKWYHNYDEANRQSNIDTAFPGSLT